MGNSCHKGPSCCSSPVICTAHVSCSIPIWCGCGPNSAKVVPVDESEPRPKATATNSNGESSAVNSIGTDGPSPASPRPPGAAGDSDSLEAEKESGGQPSSTDRSGGVASPRPATSDPQPLAPVDSFEKVAAHLHDDLETGEPVANLEAGAAAQRIERPDEEEEEDAESEDEEDVMLSEYFFHPETLDDLEHFGLVESCATLAKHPAGRPAVQDIESICAFARTSGAAYCNCKRLIAHVKTVTEFLERALDKGGLRKLVRRALTHLHPVLAKIEALVQCWEHKGSVERFFSGRAADDEFVALHLELRDCCQTPPFRKLLRRVAPRPQHQGSSHPDDRTSDPLECSDPQPPGDAEEGTAGFGSGAEPTRLVGEPSGYGSVEASRMAFDRLQLLFILRYKPLKTRTQKQRLMDLLSSYNCSSISVEEKIEHLVKTRLDKTATGALPLLRAVLTNMWGATDVPRVRIEKWRLAVRLALEPLMVATGEWQLPQTPEVGVEDFVE